MYINFILTFLLAIIALPGTAQTINERTFSQDIATVYTTENGLPSGPVGSITLDEGVPTAGAGPDSYQLREERWVRLPNRSKVTRTASSGLKPDATKVLSEVKFNSDWVIGTTDGLYLAKKGQKAARIFPSNETYHWALRNVAVVLVDARNRLWFAAEEGVGYLENGKWRLFTGKEGLPYAKFTCGAAGPDGTVWFGTTKGAIRTENDFFHYRHSRRWLPDDHVNQIAIGPDGIAWIATNGGVSKITPTELTLDTKASYFTQQVEERHNRMGFIAQSHLTKQFDIGTSQLAISDNDGMYTAMYGAAQAFRYAVTGDPEAKKLADRSFKACKWLVDISHEPGFPARVIIPADWHEPVNEQYSREMNKRIQESDPMWKDIFPRFPKSKDGRYLWKCDTSSDELAGHYFFYGIYYDLVAKTEEEKQAVRQVVGDITDHLIRHGYRLVDHDGKVTRWGDFSPDYFHSPYGFDQRGLNSMMMLSFLNVARHVTGNPKYDEEARILREQHYYHIFALHAKEFFPPENVVPWDNNLCLMSLYGLLLYEQDPSLLLMYRHALETAWLHVSKQTNAFWDTIYAALAGHFAELADKQYFNNKGLFPENPLYAPAAVKNLYQASNDNALILENLQKIPLDLIGYEMDNTHRLDVVADPTPGQNDDMGWRSNGLALPIDERGHVRQDRDAFALKMSEGNGYAEHEGTFFLLPYYMSRYHGLLK